MEDRTFCKDCPHFDKCEGPCAYYIDAMLEQDNEWMEDN